MAEIYFMIAVSLALVCVAFGIITIVSRTEARVFREELRVAQARLTEFAELRGRIEARGVASLLATSALSEPTISKAPAVPVTRMRSSVSRIEELRSQNSSGI
jgi:hypothetical protein